MVSVLLLSGGCGGGLQVNPDLRNLIALQDIDQKIVILKKQVSEIPEKTNIFRNELEQLVQTHKVQVAHFQEAAKLRRARENDVELMRSKLSRLREQLMSVKTNKEYTAMLHEIQGAEGQIRAAEDGILDIMGQMESMEGKLAQEDKDLKAKQAEVELQIQSAEKSVPALEVEIVRLGEEKGALESLIPAELLARYRRIADARRGIALAEAKNELCSACHVRIRPQVVAELLRTDDIHVCDSCSRILFVRLS
jgi:uncharacterized protein